MGDDMNAQQKLEQEVTQEVMGDTRKMCDAAAEVGVKDRAERLEAINKDHELLGSHLEKWAVVMDHAACVATRTRLLARILIEKSETLEEEKRVIQHILNGGSIIVSTLGFYSLIDDGTGKLSHIGCKDLVKKIRSMLTADKGKGVEVYCAFTSHQRMGLTRYLESMIEMYCAFTSDQRMELTRYLESMEA